MKKRLEDFQYDDAELANLFHTVMNQTDFEGVSVSNFNINFKMSIVVVGKLRTKHFTRVCSPPGFWSNTERKMTSEANINIKEILKTIF